MNGLILLANSKSYTDESLDGMGALKGAACQITSITDIEGGHRINFLWLDNSEVEHTDHMDVMNGEKGDKGDTGVGLPEGGTAGQVLVKKSSTDYDMEWDTPAGGGDMLKSVYDTDNDGKVDSAENADKVDGHNVAKDVPADAVFTDTVYDDTEIRGEIDNKVDKVSGKGLSTEDYTSEEKTKLAGVEEGAEVNTIESITLNGTEVTPDANKNVALTVITKAVNDLVNYYLKSETYSKTEVDDIVTAIKNSRFEVVTTLPTTDIKTNVIYLVPKSSSQTSNVKDEYINLDGTTAGWEKIGDTEIDLSDYVTTQALNTALAAYTTTADLTTLLAAKQDTLTFDNAPTENSNNPVKSGGVYSADDKIYQVMGQNSAKNFIPFDLDRIKAKNTTGTWNGNVYSLNGIDFTFNSDGTVDASGTATETASVHYYDPIGLPPFGGDRILKLTGCPSGGGSGTTYKVMAYRAGEVDGSTGTAEDYGDGISLRWLNNGSGIKAFISISVYTGAGTIDLTFKPMLRLSTDTDNTFAPYAKTNQQLTQDKAEQAEVNDIVNVLSAKNLLPYNLASIIAINTNGTWSGNDCTKNGVTFTVNDDGSITVNGTATANTFLDICTKNAFTNSIFTANLSLSGVSEKTVGGYTLSMGIVSSDAYIGYTKSNNTVWLAVNNGKTVSNLTVYPMIRLASIQDDTYEPYTKTNQELTKDVNGLIGNELENGVVNLLPTPYTSVDATVNGITRKYNVDGSVTLRGTATTSTSYEFKSRLTDNFVLPAGKYKIKCIVNGTYTGVVHQQIKKTVSGVGVDVVDSNLGNENEFTVDSNTGALTVQVIFSSGAAITNSITVYPMIYRSELSADKYYPYAKGNVELTKEVTGLIENKNVFGVKNLIPFPYSYTSGYQKNGITFTINDDNSITANGTFSTVATSFQLVNKLNEVSPKLVEYARKGAILSGGLGSGDTITFEWYDSDSQYLSSSGVSSRGTVNVPTNAVYCNLILYISKGSRTSVNETFYPMLTLPSETDFTYEPYAKGNQELTKETTGLIDNENILGAKNFLKQVIDNVSIPNVGDIGDRASSANGLSFTYNDDGSITVNGTPTDSTLRVEIKLDWKTNSYKNNDISAIAGKDVIGSIVPIAVDGIQMRLGYFEANGTGHQSDAITTSLKYTLPQNAKYLRTYISISGAYSYNNVTLYPMARLASDPDDTYVPYAKSNKELTEDVKELSTNDTKLVGLSASMSIFDVLANRSLYPSNNTYWRAAATITNGSNTLSSLLNINDNSIVRIDVYDDWYIGIEINDAVHGSVLIAWANKTTTELKFIRINTSTSPYVSQVTVSKAT